ncbi:sulphite reductase hemo protein, beta subunit [Calocera cornea HHB12733]|uniref:assimilatory sulfite reductase (NADPH) n=1 Tax=Calocera cornea HHB12733 TaxID=1353952 RepID=A0A165DRT4_9BASI|nr:sulphite reductase hemo protein, beta subunit [Calocera cornea HHB12733]
MAAQAVTRIAGLTSTLLVTALPAATDAQIVLLPAAADPLPHLPLAPAPATLTTLLLLLGPSPSSALSLLPRLPPYAHTPLVLTLLLPPASDLAAPLALATALPFALHSTTAQEAQDHQLLAARLARTERKAVLHLVHLSPLEEDSVQELSAHSIATFIAADVRPVNGHSTGNGTRKESTDDPALQALFAAYQLAAAQTLNLVHHALPAYYYHGAPAPHTLLLALGAPLSPLVDALPTAAGEGAALLSLALVRPWPANRLLAAVPESVRRVVVLEQTQKRAKRWSALYLELVAALQSRPHPHRPTLSSATLGRIAPEDGQKVLAQIVRDAEAGAGPNKLYGEPLVAEAPRAPHVPQHEHTYLQLLDTVFPDRLEVVNDPATIASQGAEAARPEYALGVAQARLELRERLVRAVKTLLREGKEHTTGVTDDLHILLAQWVKEQASPGAGALGAQIVGALQALPSASLHPAAHEVLALQEHFASKSRWIINSDTWSYDLGRSGLHHLLASGANVNLLLLDTAPYSSRAAGDPERRKKDAGLYALNRGDVYVASVAVYSSYAQVLQALVEADAYPGPAVVLAYLPYGEDEAAPALDVLKETKRAVDAGYWPLYRWDPAKREPFALDSEAVKADLREFLDRQNHLSLLEAAEQPQIAAALVGSLGQDLLRARQQRVKEAYDALLGGLEGPRVLVMYASDGGAAEKVAKRLAGRARARGLAASFRAMDELSWAEWAADDVRKDGFTLFVTSTAGQGEPPQNGRNTFKQLSAVLSQSAGGEKKPLDELRYAVFGMGDSHYWPRAEDAHYYNKPGKDLDGRLEALGATRVVDLGLGDDQDADGPETGYRAWEPLLWRALGVGDVEVLEAEPEPITNEYIKIASNYLRGSIAEGLRDTTTGALAPSDGQLTKFHGIYEQDDRDIRDERKDAGLEPAYAFMIRVRMPGGVCRPEQWRAISQIADEHGNGTFKLTTRQTFQFHGVIKRHLKPAVQAINRALLDTIAACGDVNRGVLCSALPALSTLHAETYALSKKISEHLMPRTSAYHEIWLDKKQVAGNAVKDMEPLYGPYYLPRKFKIAIAIPPNNDVDVFCNDVGLIAIADEKGHLAGYNVSIGGGMGVTHSNKKTYPRLGDVIGFVKPEEAHLFCEKVMLVQRDNGNRQDRKNARLKYTIDRMGLDVFKKEVEKLLGHDLEPARPYSFENNLDQWGWKQSMDGKWNFTMFVENGRVQDEPGKPYKTGLVDIAKVHKGTFRLTANQHLILAEVDEKDLPEMKKLLAKYKLDNIQYTGLRLSSSACVAFPTCGLAMAESERYLPVLIDKVEKFCEEAGLRNDEIVMRMTGCPNGCARPYAAEVAFVGKAPGSYMMLLGGGFYGQRLNKIYRETVSEPEILAILKPMIKRYALERNPGERFGDWTIRAGYISPVTSGKEWYEGMGGNM